MSFSSFALFLIASVGVVCVAIQAALLWRFLRAQMVRPSRPVPAISILKPLAGCDDGLTENLTSFAELDYPEYEVLLGVHREDDPAVPVARQMIERWPGRFRLVLQQGAPGLNPKVNQLITLAKAAQHEVLLVSDASVRVGNGYLPEIAARLEDSEVGLVTHIFAAEGERTLGSLFDNVYLMSHFAAGAIAARDAGGQTLVNGKSNAFRRADLEAMGGFDAVRDYAAEDFILGLWVSSKLQKRVCFARYTPATISVRRSIAEYLKRYQRWSLLQRTGGGYLVYLLQVMMYPLLLATLGLILSPSWVGLGWWLGIAFGKSALDVTQAKMLRKSSLSPLAFVLGPVNDMLIAWIFLYGLLFDTVVWRGTVMKVTWGTKLVPRADSTDHWKQT